MDRATQLRLLEGNLATFRARLATTADRDQVRRQIKAVQDQIRQVRDGADCASCGADHAPFLIIKATAGQGVTEKHYCGPCYLDQD